MKLVQIGAGNIGRSFIGQIFSRAGWELVFVDVDPGITALLNEARFYTVVIKREGQADERRRIGPVRAVDGGNAEAVIGELVTADLAATSVGKGALPKVLPVLAGGILERSRKYPGRPLDIIIAENVRDAADLFRTVIGETLSPPAFSGTGAVRDDAVKDNAVRDDAAKDGAAAFEPWSGLVGLVETSIGKMVPIMRKEDLALDPLQLFAEAYETLIVDKLGFRGPMPDIPAIHPVEDIAAYVDRKLFIHNMGHAAAAYLGYRLDSSKTLLAEVLDLPGVEGGVRRAMEESAAALAREYPRAYSEKDLADHIDDLVSRFKNRALGDTVHRVGRDLKRKLSRDDRIVGAMLLCAKQGLPFGAVAEVYRAALDFAAPDEKGALFPGDARFREAVRSRGVETALQEVSGLDRERDAAVYRTLSSIL
ncbi:MAG: mannitol-1-phosphate 5-dehydrogenase [Treponema sp.]|nr:mannitol-1-phosphate 5-dehydrogenase [Treponema sp.]